MASHAAGQPSHLRLVGADAQGQQSWQDTDAIAKQIATENRRAGANPDLSPTDPRWVLAVRAYSQLEGSTLTPERRQRILRTAGQLGVRPFDANVIIAIVQDHARSGRELRDARPTLELLNHPGEQDSNRDTTRWLAALVLAAAVNLLLMWWLLST
jgi:hypothetical protein